MHSRSIFYILNCLKGNLETVIKNKEFVISLIDDFVISGDTNINNGNIT